MRLSKSVLVDDVVFNGELTILLMNRCFRGESMPVDKGPGGRFI